MLPKKNFFCIASKVEFQGDGNFRLGKIKRVNFVNNQCNQCCAHLQQLRALCLPPPKLRTSTLICLCALQDNFQVQVLFQVQLENDLFTLFEKDCQTRYSLLNVLIISFLAFHFQLQILFYLLAHTYYDILHTSNHSESEIKF